MIDKEDKKFTDKEKLQELKKPMPISVRDGRAGEVYRYVSNHNVVKRLNYVFGLSWSKEILREVIQPKEVAVLVRLHYPLDNGEMAYKDSWGGKIIETINKDGKIFRLPLGDGLKTSASLALVKAAQDIGIKVLDDDDELSDETKQEIIELSEKLEMEFDTKRFDGMSEKQGQDITLFLKSKLK